MDLRITKMIRCVLRIWIIYLLLDSNEACVFHNQNGAKSEAEGVRFVRVREDLLPGNSILTLSAYPRTSVVIRGLERSHDYKYFTVKEINATTVQIVLSKPLEDLVDQDVPQNLLKFRILCTGREEVSYMSVTVYVEDINDHAPVFVDDPYVIEVDESTPIGTTIFQGIQVFDRDKPNTPNSDVHVTFGQAEQASGSPYFVLESPHRPYVMLKRSLDFDHGLRHFQIPLIASDRGSPIRTTNTTLTILVKDHDDLPPKFSEGVYRTKINEFYPMTDRKLEIPLTFVPSIKAFDQDSLNASLMYDIISGNERQLFKVNSNTGQIYLIKEIDLEEESLPGNTIVLQIEARQRDSPLKRAVARVEIEILDLNDNPPEFEVDIYNISIVENLPSGFSVLQVNAIDRDQGENAEFFYNISAENPSGAFGIDPRTGWITVRNHSLLDREVRSSITMTVHAVERVPSYDQRNEDLGTVHVEITLLDSNDNTPQFENGNLYEFKVNANAIVGSVIGKVSATDPDQGKNGFITYELQRPKGSGYIPFRLDSQTGTMFVSGVLRKGRIALFVEASDQPTNPSERRFSLAVVTIEVHTATSGDTIDFVGAPYEFWVGADVAVGTSVGQVRTTLDYDGNDGGVNYDLLHSYPEGVPFAIEERSGIVTVIRDLDDFDRKNYYFESVANVDQKINTSQPKSRLIRRTSRSERQITRNGEVIEIDEGVISDTENILVTNVTIHVVSPNDERGILTRGTNLNPIEFHVSENLAGAIIGRLLYKNSSKSSEGPLNFSDIVGQTYRGEQVRQDRLLGQKFMRTSSVAPRNSVKRLKRDLVDEMDIEEYATTEALDTSESQGFGNGKGRGFPLPTPKRFTTWKPRVTTRKGASSFEVPSMITPSSSENNQPHPVYRSHTRNSTGLDSTESAKSDKSMSLRFLIANQADVENKITITEDGTLMTLSGLDREVRDLYQLTVIAEYSKGFSSGAGIYQINIHVDDVNDNPPVFDHLVYSGIISENSLVGTEVVLNRVIRVTDADAGRNAEYTLSLSGEGSQMFKLEFINASLTANSSINSLPFPESQERFDIEKSFIAMELVLLNPNQSLPRGPHHVVRYIGASNLDRERESFYKLTITATDAGRLRTTASLNILVADINDNAPAFEKISVYKNSGIEVIDYSDDIEIVSAEKSPAYPPTSKPKISVLGEYSILGTPRLANDTRAQRSRRERIRTRVRQSRKLKTTPLFSILESIAVGTPILMVTAIDEDTEKNAQVFYQITSQQILTSKKFRFKLKDVPYFSIDRLSGEVKIAHPLQAETEIILNLTAHDVGDLSDSTTIRFKVVDINDHAPLFKKSWYSFDLEEGMYYDQTIDKIEATDDDYGVNANITYRIVSSESIPFHIWSRNGALRVNGNLDREMKSEYLFHIIASDNAVGEPQLSSSVEVEINILDVNDNAPEFIGYDEMVYPDSAVSYQTGRRLITDVDRRKMQLSKSIPVYKAYLSRNTMPGTYVKQITAVDKDYAGNGNGLVMFSLLHHKLPHLFEIDSRDGVITTISRFGRYNGYEHVNLTIIASDLGSPSKSSTALFLVNLQGEEVVDDDETNLFTHKYYELEVEENNNYPLALLKFNVSSAYSKEVFKWSVVSEYGKNEQESFAIDPRNGTLTVIKSLDREEHDVYRLKVRADRLSRESRTYPTLKYPVAGDSLGGLMDNEVRVVVRVSDINDNPPKFKGNGRPIVTIIPNTANFGYPVTQVEAFDRDAGVNSEIRYKLLNEPSRLFGIDEVTGKIRVLGPVRSDQRVYGFDVKATDRRGEDDGKSSIANVFVYVLDEHRQVRLVVSGKPIDVEREADILMNSLSEATGMDVRIRLLEPHIGGSEPATDVYVYAIDPKSNSVIDMDDLQKAMSLLDMRALAISPSAHVLELSELGKYRSRAGSKGTISAMSGTELASIILAIVVFAGGLATSLCVVCIRYKRRQILPRTDGRLPAYAVARVPSIMGTGHTSKTATTTTNSPESKRSHDDLARITTTFSPLKTSAKGLMSAYDDRPREYIDVPLPKSVINSSLNLAEHESACLRFNQIHANIVPQDTSMQSHLSSGHDSGVGFVTRDRSQTPQGSLIRIMHHRQSLSGIEQCSCGRVDTSACCTGDSSDSYEDSLKNQEARKKPTQPSAQGRNHGFRRSVRNPRSRQVARHSFSGVRDDLIQQSPRIGPRPRGNSFRYSVSDLERRLHNLEQSFREPFHLKSNSRC